MTIIDPKAVAGHIGDWLVAKLTEHDEPKTAVLGLSGGIDSALVSLLCASKKIPLMCVAMPCHSSPESAADAIAFAREHDIRLITVDATVAADSVTNQVDAQTPLVQREDAARRNDLAGIYSCSRAPILDYVAKRMNGLIVGTGNRDEDHLLRYFAKRGDGSVDISPIADLHKSEVRALFKWLGEYFGRSTGTKGLLPSAERIYQKLPSADLWGGKPQTDADELDLPAPSVPQNPYEPAEWVDCFVLRAYPGDFWAQDPMERNRIIIAWKDSKAITHAQAQCIQKVSAMEWATKHKANPNIPVCSIHATHPEWFA